MTMPLKAIDQAESGGAAIARLRMPEAIGVALRHTLPPVSELLEPQQQDRQRASLCTRIDGLAEFAGTAVDAVQRMGGVVIEDCTVGSDAAVVLLSSFFGAVDAVGNDGDPAHIVVDVAPAREGQRVSMAGTSSGAGEFWLHTDSANFTPQHDLVTLACVSAVPGRGGESVVLSAKVVADALLAAGRGESLRLLGEPAYPFMSGFDYADGDRRRAASILRAPVLWHADDRWRIRYARHFLAPGIAASSLDAPLVRALADFEAVIADQGMVSEFALRPGDLWALDNTRWLHGRRSIDPGSPRLLKRCKGYLRGTPVTNTVEHR